MAPNFPNYKKHLWHGVESSFSQLYHPQTFREQNHHLWPGLGYGDTDLAQAQRAAGAPSQANKALPCLGFSGWGLTDLTGEGRELPGRSSKGILGHFSSPVREPHGPSAWPVPQTSPEAFI